MSIELGPDERRAISEKARVAVLDAIKALGGEGTRKAILDRALADPRFTPDELASTTQGDKPQGLVATRLSFELANLKREGLLENPERGHWRLTEAGAAKPKPLIRERVSLERLGELRAMSPSEYLETEEWQRTRATALELAGNRCARDRRHRDELDVHHTVRVRIGAELPSDLVVLCATCHAAEQHRAPVAVGGPPPESSETPDVASVSVAPPTLVAAPAPEAPAEPAEVAEPDRSLLKRIFSRAA